METENLKTEHNLNKRELHLNNTKQEKKIIKKAPFHTFSVCKKLKPKRLNNKLKMFMPAKWWHEHPPSFSPSP